MKRVYNLIGIAQRAGKTSSGTMAARNSLIRHRACILLMSKDIAENTRELLMKSCAKQNIPWLVLGDKYEIGASIGKAYRVAITINDPGMASAIVKAVEAAKEAKTMGVVEWPK
ncbi:MAG: ribosomal L7Ae/L30e/S12e/Gadd45 family protein [Syntrophomonas sp.]|nr:ribosomal L7Ae/L30e/S12e/Gadd45 family protein [Syntrophomonas sp.]